MLLNFFEMFLANRLHIIWFETGENAAQFSPRYFLAHRLRGKCCPYFSRLHIKTGGNAAHFSQRLFLHIDLAFFGSAGKMLPIFLQGFFLHIASHFCSKQAKMLLNFLSKKMFLHIDFTLSRSKQGKMLPIFLQEFFLHMDLAFGPCFSHENLFCTSKRGNAAQFSPRFFSCKSTSHYLVQARGKCCPIFSKKFLLANRLHIIWFKQGENAAHFSPITFSCTLT